MVIVASWHTGPVLTQPGVLAPCPVCWGLRGRGTGQAMAARGSRCPRLGWPRNMRLRWVAGLWGRVGLVDVVSCPACCSASWRRHGELTRLSSLLSGVRHLLHTPPLRLNYRGWWGTDCFLVQSGEKAGLSAAGSPSLQASQVSAYKG